MLSVMNAKCQKFDIQEAVSLIKDRIVYQAVIKDSTVVKVEKEEERCVKRKLEGEAEMEKKRIKVELEERKDYGVKLEIKEENDEYFSAKVKIEKETIGEYMEPESMYEDALFLKVESVDEANESASSTQLGPSKLQHSLPSVQLKNPFIPTHMAPFKLRQFHRPPLKRYSFGLLSSYSDFHGVDSLGMHQNDEEKKDEDGVNDFLIQEQPEDLSGKNGDLVLIEYVEENPPLLSFVGMCTKITNYYKRKPGLDEGPSDLKYGELKYLTKKSKKSPFGVTVSSGEAIQAIENNMYRAPIYEHKLPDSDFIVIRTRTEFSVRDADALFVSGQEDLLYKIPAPNSKQDKNFQRVFERDFLLVFIYRLFQKSRKINLDVIKKAFPNYTETRIRKSLKTCAKFHREEGCLWVLKPEFRLPSEEEIRAMVNPEQCVAYYSMMAAEKRKCEAAGGKKEEDGKDEKEEDGKDESQMKMFEELKIAPWNITSMGVQAVKETSPDIAEEKNLKRRRKRKKEKKDLEYEMQKKVLASEEVLLSSDETDNSEDNDDLDEKGRKKDDQESTTSNMVKNCIDDKSDGPKKVLKITRTFKNSDGKEYTKTELVQCPQVVERYIKIRTAQEILVYKK